MTERAKNLITWTGVFAGLFFLLIIVPAFAGWIGTLA